MMQVFSLIDYNMWLRRFYERDRHENKIKITMKYLGSERELGTTKDNHRL